MIGRRVRPKCVDDLIKRDGPLGRCRQERLQANLIQCFIGAFLGRLPNHFLNEGFPQYVDGMGTAMGWLLEQEPMDQSSDRVDVGFGADGSERRVDLFRGGEAQCSTKQLSSACGGRPRETEVGDGDSIVVVYQNIARREVAVNKACLVDGFEGLADLNKPACESFGRGMRHGMKRLTIDPLTQQVRAAVR